METQGAVLHVSTVCVEALHDMPQGARGITPHPQESQATENVREQKQSGRSPGSNMCHNSHSVQPLKLPRRTDVPMEEGWGDGGPPGRVRSVTAVTAKVVASR